MYQAGLILEGGGMKGIYTAGVLDFFLDKDIEFSVLLMNYFIFLFNLSISNDRKIRIVPVISSHILG